MGRLRVRDPSNVKWIDICQSEFYVRNAANTEWYRLLPARGLYARHGSNEYWIPIGCTTDDPEGKCPDEYGGTPDGNGENGSGPGNDGSGDGGNGNGGGDGGNGNGGGSNGGGSGSTFDPNLPYTPGYGMPSDPDSNGGNQNGGSDSSLIGTGDGQLVIINPDGDVETFDPGKDGQGGGGGDGAGGGGNGSDGALGTFGNPYKCPVTVASRGYQVTEFYVDMGQTSGTVKVHYNMIGRASIDVYHGGVLRATTKGKVSGRGVIKWEYNVADAKGDGRVFVRVRADSGTLWSLAFACPTVEEQDDYGTPSKPATCRGTFTPTHGGGAGVHENVHTMGKGGRVVIEYQMWYQPDRMDILYQGRVIASTNTHVSGTGRLEFQFAPVGSDTDIVIRVSSLDGTTSWTYIMTCPDEDGSQTYPKPCGDDSATTSGGAGVTDTYFDLSEEPAGAMAVRYQMWNIPDLCEVFQNGTLVATTTSPVAGENYLRFNYDPARGGELRVRITGPDNATSWSFLIECPGDSTPPTINAGNVAVREGNEGDRNKMCFPVTLSKASTSPVSVDYSTSDGSAKGVVANARILATDQHNEPFIAVVDQANMGRVAMDGGFPKFYNTNYVAPEGSPTGQEVFNTWARSSNGNFYADPSTIPSNSEAARWTFNSTTGAISSTINSSSLIAFLSPKSNQDSYTFEATLRSSDTDDDMIGLVVAQAMSGSDNWMLLATRHRGGMSYGPNTFGLVLTRNGTIVRNVGTKQVGGSGGWSGTSTRVRVERDCQSVRVYCSTFGSSEILASSELTADLSASDLVLFKTSSRWGFCAHSQLNATFVDIALSGIGLPPQFTYLKNLIEWSAYGARKTGGSKKVLITCDAPTGSVYSLDTQASGFRTSMAGTVEAAGYTPIVKDIYSWDAVGVIPYSELITYESIIFIGSSVASRVLRPESVSNFGAYVKNGGGLILITDHNVFHANVNPLANLFNAEFYGDIDRGAISVAATITKHGDHQAWDGLLCESIPAGGSEGAIRLTQVKSDYVPIGGTLTFAPGETSKTVCVDIIGDNEEEPDETINFNITNPVNGTIGTGTGIGTIINDDSPLCRQNPTAPVYERGGGPNGSNLLHVQPDFNCAAANTIYMLVREFNFPNSGVHTFSFYADDDYELFIDCKLVASGAIGAVRTHNINVSAGQRYLILRYRNIPGCTPGYVAMSIQFNGQIVMVTKAADWRGQANVNGSIEAGKPEPAVPPPASKPSACTAQPAICAIYQESFNRLPDEGGANFWASEIARNGWNTNTTAGYSALRTAIRRGASPTDCALIGGTYDSTNKVCNV